MGKSLQRGVLTVLNGLNVLNVNAINKANLFVALVFYGGVLFAWVLQLINIRFMLEDCSGIQLKGYLIGELL